MGACRGRRWFLRPDIGLRSAQLLGRDGVAVLRLPCGRPLPRRQQRILAAALGSAAHLFFRLDQTPSGVSTPAPRLRALLLPTLALSNSSPFRNKIQRECPRHPCSAERMDRPPALHRPLDSRQAHPCNRRRRSVLLVFSVWRFPPRPAGDPARSMGGSLASCLS